MSLSSGNKNDVPPFGAIILAAGSSTRFVKGNKLLATINGVTILEKVLRALLNSKVEFQTVAVVPPIQNQLADLATRYCNLVCENLDFESGMGSSIACGVNGLQQLNNSYEGIVIFLGDTPALKASSIDEVVSVFLNERSERIARPVYNNQPGHPVVFPYYWMQTLAELKGDQGAGSIIKRNQQYLVQVPVDDWGVCRDCDTWEDFCDLRSEEEEN